MVQYPMKCELESVLSDTIWTNERVNTIYPEVSMNCSRCDLGICEFLLHVYPCCPANATCEDPIVQNSLYLIRTATENVADVLCLWLRGLLPAHLVEVKDILTDSVILYAQILRLYPLQMAHSMETLRVGGIPLILHSRDVE